MKIAHRYLVFIIVIAIVVGLVVGFSFFKNQNIGKDVVSAEVQVGNSAAVEYKPILVTKENLAGFLQGQQLIKDIPDKGIILLKLYNFDTGERQIEESYVLTKAKVEKGDVNGDVIIYLHSKYVSQLGDLCNAMKTAKQNGDLGFESGMNEAALMWKYRGLMKYKACFGM